MCCASFTIQIHIDFAYVNMVLTNSVKQIPRPMNKFCNRFSFIEAVKRQTLIKRNTYIAGSLYWSQSLQRLIIECPQHNYIARRKKQGNIR